MPPTRTMNKASPSPYVLSTWPLLTTLQTRPRNKSRNILALLVAIIAFAGVVGVLAASGYSVPSFSSKGGTKHITMDHVFNGTFNAYSKQIDWVKEGKVNVFSVHMHRVDGQRVQRKTARSRISTGMVTLSSTLSAT